MFSSFKNITNLIFIVLVSSVALVSCKSESKDPRLAGELSTGRLLYDPNSVREREQRVLVMTIFEPNTLWEHNKPRTQEGQKVVRVESLLELDCKDHRYR